MQRTYNYSLFESAKAQIEPANGQTKRRKTFTIYEVQSRRALFFYSPPTCGLETEQECPEFLCFSFTFTYYSKCAFAQEK